MQNLHGVATKAMAGVFLVGVLVFGGGPSPQAEEPAWWPGFCGPGTDGNVYSSLVYGEKLVVGGSFSRAGGYTYPWVAQWDGMRWLPLGDGVNYPVTVLCEYNGCLIAGGYFTEAGGNAANYIASWNGVEWSPLGEGVDGYVWALGIHNGDLVVGGEFTMAGGQPASGVARWDGEAWHAFGGEFNDRVRGVTSYEGALLVGGEFTDVGPQEADYVVTWDGYEWQPIGPSPNDGVLTVGQYDGEVVFGGCFTEAGGIPASRVAKWDGQNWTPLGEGVDDWLSCYVAGVEQVHDELAVYGRFTEVSGLEASNIALWDGVGWRTAGADHGPFRTATQWGNGLFVGGLNDYFQGLVCPNVSYWTGEEWQQLGHGLVCDSPEESFVRRMLVYDDQLVIIGGFSQGDMIRSKCIMAWDGDRWIDMFGPELVAPLDGFDCLTTYQGELIIGGRFTNISGNPQTSLIVAWDGSGYHELGVGLNGFGVLAVCEHDGDLYAGGGIDEMGGGGDDIDNLAIWDGSTWQNAYGGLNAAVHGLVSHQNSLYVGGHFTAASYVPANYIARLDGASWHTLGSGLNDAVSCLAEYDDRIIVGGEFTQAGGVPANHIAAWDPATETWSPLGDGLVVTGDMPVEDMLVVADRLYVCGRFSEAGGIPANNVAYWDGSSWHAFEDQPNGAVLGLGYYQDELYLGGEFTAIGDIRSHFVARWDGFPTSDIPSTAPAGTVLHLAPCRPNPAHGHTAIRFQLPAATAVDVGVYDVLGRKVRTLGTGMMLAGEHAMRWDGRSDVGHEVESGIYYIQLETPGESESKTVTVVR